MTRPAVFAIFLAGEIILEAELCCFPTPDGLSAAEKALDLVVEESTIIPPTSTVAPLDLVMASPLPPVLLPHLCSAPCSPLTYRPPLAPHLAPKPRPPPTPRPSPKSRRHTAPRRPAAICPHSTLYLPPAPHLPPVPHPRSVPQPAPEPGPLTAPHAALPPVLLRVPRAHATAHTCWTARLSRMARMRLEPHPIPGRTPAAGASPASDDPPTHGDASPTRTATSILAFLLGGSITPCGLPAVGAPPAPLSTRTDGAPPILSIAPAVGALLAPDTPPVAGGSRTSPMVPSPTTSPALARRSPWAIPAVPLSEPFGDGHLPRAAHVPRCAPSGTLWPRTGHNPHVRAPATHADDDEQTPPPAVGGENGIRRSVSSVFAAHLGTGGCARRAPLRQASLPPHRREHAQRRARSVKCDDWALRDHLRYSQLLELAGKKEDSGVLQAVRRAARQSSLSYSQTGPPPESPRIALPRGPLRLGA